MRFVDRAGDVHPGIDDAETICAEFHRAMSEVIERMAAPQQEPSRDAKTWCSYVAGMIGCYLKKPDESAEVRAIAGIIERRLWALPAPKPAPAPLSEREAFERDWEKRHAPAPINSRTRDDGRYGDSSIQDAWESWQARAALAAQGGRDAS